MNIAIILAGGKSTRFGSDKPLQMISNKPMIMHSVDAFLCAKIDKIIVVANTENFQKIKKLVPKSVRIILGGRTRQESVFNAIKFLEKSLKNEDVILIHNVANPFVSKEEIKNCIRLVEKYGACITGHLATDTVKMIDGNFIKQTLPREKILLAQTPQGFKWGVLYKAYKNALTKNISATDDAFLVEQIGQKVAWTEANPLNKKLTFEHDLKPDLIGIGADFHEFSHAGTLTLAGLKFPKFHKLSADSDGDAIFHAITASISSALGQGSLGTFATSMCKSGIKNSAKYLEKIFKQMSEKGYSVSNLSLSIESNEIKIDPISSKLKSALSRLLKINESQIGITAIRGKNKNGLYCISAILLRQMR
ncbi:MAG: 2-C-methyl-D-erythritol 2,4-cyclodiphosphate synthase [Candidatus Gracilibacteria bacterium]